MTVKTDVILPNPVENFGAVYGRLQHKQNKRYLIFSGIALVWLNFFALLIVAHVNPEVPYATETFYSVSIAFLILAFLVGFFGGFSAVFSYNEDVYALDMYRGRATYAGTVFRDWLEERYGMKVTSDNALSLMDGYTVSVPRVSEDGRTERVKVFFDYNTSFRTLAELAKRPTESYLPSKENWPLDTEKIHFELLVMEEPQKPRTYVWN